MNSWHEVRSARLLIVVLLAGCGPDGVARGSEHGDTGETGETDEVCEAEFEPVTNPLATPVVYAFDPACTDVIDTHVIELPLAELHGTVTYGGPVRGGVMLRGQSGQGDAALAVADDGTYATPLLAGRYDVIATIGVTAVAIDEVTVTGSTALDIVIPAARRFTGRVTAEGVELAAPAGIFLVWDGGARQLGDGTTTIAGSLEWDVAVAPGTYQLDYRRCLGPLEAGGACSDFSFYPRACGRPPVELDVPTFVIDEALDITDDLHFETTLPAVRLTGHLSIAGDMPTQWYGGYNGLDCWPVLNLWGPRPDQGISVAIDDNGDFDARVFVGEYGVHVGVTSGEIEQLSLHDDQHVDLAIESFELDAMLSPSIDVLGAWPADGEFELRRSDDVGALRLQADGELMCTASSFGPVFPGVYELVRRDAQPLDHSHAVDGHMTITDNVPLARVSATAGGLEDWAVNLLNTSEGWVAESIGPDNEFVVVVPGRYQVSLRPSGAELGSADIVDGSMLILDLQERELAISVLADGELVDDADIWVQRRGRPTAVLLPGTYDVYYDWPGQASLPRNQAAKIGCVNLVVPEP